MLTFRIHCDRTLPLHDDKTFFKRITTLGFSADSQMCGLVKTGKGNTNNTDGCHVSKCVFYFYRL